MFPYTSISFSLKNEKNVIINETVNEHHLDKIKKNLTICAYISELKLIPAMCWEIEVVNRAYDNTLKTDKSFVNDVLPLIISKDFDDRKDTYIIIKTANAHQFIKEIQKEAFLTRLMTQTLSSLLNISVKIILLDMAFSQNQDLINHMNLKPLDPGKKYYYKETRLIKETAVAPYFMKRITKKFINELNGPLFQKSKKNFDMIINGKSKVEINGTIYILTYKDGLFYERQLHCKNDKMINPYILYAYLKKYSNNLSIKS